MIKIKIFVEHIRKQGSQYLKLMYNKCSKFVCNTTLSFRKLLPTSKLLGVLEVGPGMSLTARERERC